MLPRGSVVSRLSDDRWRGAVRLTRAGMLTLALSACATPTKSTLSPWPSEPAEVMASRARLDCRIRRGSAYEPPHPFTTDGCSVSPDGDWLDCCITHDLAYWCGGTSEERKLADEALKACVARVSPARAPFMWLGVRMGGAPWMPAPWRWGYGWDYPAGYANPARAGTREDSSKSVPVDSSRE